MIAKLTSPGTLIALSNSNVSPVLRVEIVTTQALSCQDGNQVIGEVKLLYSERSKISSMINKIY
jgi:hypothetical protein